MRTARSTNRIVHTSASASSPGRPNATWGMPEIPTSPPSASCLRTMPTKRNVTPIVVMARKSWRTRSDAMPTTNPTAPASAAAGSRARTSGAPALVSSAAV